MIYQLWQHRTSGERWIIAIEDDGEIVAVSVKLNSWLRWALLNRELHVEDVFGDFKAEEALWFEDNADSFCLVEGIWPELLNA